MVCVTPLSLYGGFSPISLPHQAQTTFNTYFLIKAEIDMVFVSIELTAEAMGLQEGVSLPTDISIVLLSYNYNQPISIELPPEAEEAIKVSTEF